MGVRFFNHETIVCLPYSKGELLRNICVTDDHWCVPFVVVKISPFPRSWLIIGFFFSHIINMSDIIGAGTAYTYRAPEFTLFFFGFQLSVQILQMIVCPFPTFLFANVLFVILLLKRRIINPFISGLHDHILQRSSQDQKWNIKQLNLKIFQSRASMNFLILKGTIQDYF